MATTYAALQAERDSLLRQRRLLQAVIVALMDGMKDCDVESAVCLPTPECNVIRELHTTARNAIDPTIPLTDYAKS